MGGTKTKSFLPAGVPLPAEGSALENETGIKPYAGGFDFDKKNCKAVNDYLTDYFPSINAGIEYAMNPDNYKHFGAENKGGDWWEDNFYSTTTKDGTCVARLQAANSINQVIDPFNVAGAEQSEKLAGKLSDAILGNFPMDLEDKVDQKVRENHKTLGLIFKNQEHIHNIIKHTDELVSSVAHAVETLNKVAPASSEQRKQHSVGVDAQGKAGGKFNSKDKSVQGGQGVTGEVFYESKNSEKTTYNPNQGAFNDIKKVTSLPFKNIKEDILNLKQVDPSELSKKSLHKSVITTLDTSENHALSEILKLRGATNTIIENMQKVLFNAGMQNNLEGKNISEFSVESMKKAGLSVQVQSDLQKFITQHPDVPEIAKYIRNEFNMLRETANNVCHAGQAKINHYKK